jgi:hypothetical protein
MLAAVQKGSQSGAGFDGVEVDVESVDENDLCIGLGQFLLDLAHRNQPVADHSLARRHIQLVPLQLSHFSQILVY